MDLTEGEIIRGFVANKQRVNQTRPLSNDWPLPCHLHPHLSRSFTMLL